MEDRNSPEAIAARAAQPDPLVMYLVVKKSLEMGPGKTAAQCAHASQQLLVNYFKHKMGYVERDRGDGSMFMGLDGSIIFDYQEMVPFLELFEQWLNTSFRKVVLVANDSQFERLKEDPNHVVVVDAGLTEIAPGSETVIGLWPRRRSTCSKLIQKLQVLK